MKVLITTIVALNPGDAAILLGTMRLLRRAFGPDVEITAVDRQASIAQRLYPWARFVPALFGTRQRGPLGRWISRHGYEHRLRSIDFLRLRLAAWLMTHNLGRLARLFSSRIEGGVIQEYLSADLVLASGGTYLVPAYNMETPLRDYEFTLALDKPLGFMPQSMGPFVGSRLAARFATVLSASRFVLVRDGRSLHHVQQLGIQAGHIEVLPDAAFAMADGEASPTARPFDAAGLRVAVSVREWQHFEKGTAAGGLERYLNGVAGLVSWLVRERGAHVTFMSSCQGIPEYWTDDASTALGVVERLDAEVAARVRLDREFRGPQELLDSLRAFDVVVATRMHVAILALCARTPVLPIAYEFKTAELFTSFGLGELVTSIDTADSDELISRMSLLLDGGSAILEKFAVGLNGLRRQVRDTENILRSSLHAASAGPGAG